MKILSDRVVVFVLVVTLFFSTLCFPVAAFNTETYDFANFTEEDSMAFVEQHGITIPENILASGKSVSFTHSLILRSYAQPNAPFCFNYYETQDYAEAIRAAVSSHMNLETLPATAVEIVDSLLYNQVRNAAGDWVSSGGDWNSKWLNYNCYAYAINRVEQPGFYVQEDELEDQNTMSQYSPGDMNDEGIRWGGNLPHDIDALADVVEADLRAMGYAIVQVSEEFEVPTDTQEVICVRRNSTIDYHFMRYDLATNAWYHKPRDTAILKYCGTPSNDSIWYIEYSKDGVEYREEDTADGDYLYDSDIRFITYTKNQINISATDTEALRTVTIQPQKDVLYELNFERLGFYNIHLTSTNRFTFDVYDENFDEVLSDSANASLSETLYVTGNKYYLRMNFVVNSTHPPLTDNCSITVSLVPYDTTD